MINLTNHFIKRYKERVQKSTATVKKTVNLAHTYGKDIEEIEDKRLKNELREAERIYGTHCRIYRGFAYWFSEDTAITVYPICSRLNRVKGELC